MCLLPIHLIPWNLEHGTWHLTLEYLTLEHLTLEHLTLEYLTLEHLTPLSG